MGTSCFEVDSLAKKVRRLITGFTLAVAGCSSGEAERFFCLDGENRYWTIIVDPAFRSARVSLRSEAVHFYQHDLLTIDKVFVTSDDIVLDGIDARENKWTISIERDYSELSYKEDDSRGQAFCSKQSLVPDRPLPPLSDFIRKE